ncbi:ferritin-like domain-containing protein [Solirubrum puertoriconensis]|uniref:Dessication-associated protein n=1 Tax=Solirubrum puertoriconensis TaxID=1751427 RepID=A0A9X0L3J4_SOLP1|nr:ferritin-like domain-containing protein [Solirubrum puertoriconensis]KUG06593.1 hypothetical protein ASU33_04415 [Solirubrum puertoriconensis]
MDLFKLISDIEKVDPEVYDRFDSRRRVFKHFGNMGKAVTAATLPAVVSGLFTRAYGQTGSLPAEIAAVLNLALQLEYLEFYFYDTGLKSANLIPAAERPGIEKIRNDESGHIKVLRGALGSQAFSQTDPPVTAFDYTGGGRFPDVFTNQATYFGVAQGFVDTGVRAYKGGAPILMPNKDLLEAALNIHSVEARHSSHIRSIRRGGPGAAADMNNLNQKPKSWISGTDNGGSAPPTTTPIYGPGTPATGGATDIFFPAESNITQAGVNIQTNTTGVTITAAGASESFDEPLDANTVKSIARLFRAPGNTVLFA